MDSSLNYKKFTVCENEESTYKETPQKSKNFWLILIGIIGMILIVIAVAAVAIGVGVNAIVSSKPQESEDTSGLNDFTVTNEIMEGEYCDATGCIYFLITVNTTDTYIIIATIDRETVFMLRHPRDLPMTMMTVNNTSFLALDVHSGETNRTNRSIYVIPEQYVSLVDGIMREHRNMSNSTLQMMDQTMVNETQNSSLVEFAIHDEAYLVILAAQSLSELGIEGTQYPPVKYFYVLALKLSNARQKMGKENLEGDLKRSFSSPKFLAQQKRTASCNDGNSCSTGRCPYKGYRDNGRECFGMCGYGCFCWSIVCGDCCVHQGCLDHDQCCADNGFFTFTCFNVVPFSCTSFSC